MAREAATRTRTRAGTGVGRGTARAGRTTTGRRTAGAGEAEWGAAAVVKAPIARQPSDGVFCFCCDVRRFAFGHTRYIPGTSLFLFRHVFLFVFVLFLFPPTFSVWLWFVQYRYMSFRSQYVPFFCTWRWRTIATPRKKLHVPPT